MTWFAATTAGALAALCALANPLAAQRWAVQYLYDEGKSDLAIVDLQFPSARRGVAAGLVQTGKRIDPVVLVTSDGGSHWQKLAVKELPISLFFLNENLGWMVTGKGIWQTTEAGRNWRKLPKPPAQVLRVCFTSETTGWAAGRKKSVIETHDGGQSWKPVAAAAEEPGNPLYSAYTSIVFANPQFGLISGYNQPPRRWGPDFPDWMDPQATLRQRDTPHLNYELVTRDGGKSWHAVSASLFGQTTRVRFTPDGRGIGLIEYSQTFRYPSEVYQVEWRSGRNRTIYRDTKLHVTDTWLDADGTAYLAGVESQAKIRGVLPGKVRVVKSADYKTWIPMETDYRATANRVALAGAGGELWMATDAGMILHLENAPSSK